MDEKKNLMLENLRKYFDSQGITQKQIAERMGVTAQHVNAIFKGRTPIGKTKAAQMENLFGLSSAWLLTGEGEMLATSPAAQIVSRQNGVPFIGDFESVVAGELAGFGAAIERKDITDMVCMPSLSWREGDFAVRTRGRSMIDKAHPEQNINDGAVVCVRPWRENYIQWGEIYCIATVDGYAVKRLMPSDKEDSVLCVSSNEAEGYKPYEVSASDIKGIGKVTAIINLQLL